MPDQLDSSAQGDCPLDTSESADQSSNLVILRRMRIMEAELAKAKLESEGIASSVRDTSMAVMHRLVVSEVPLMVHESDVARARNILDQPVSNDAAGEYVAAARSVFRRARFHVR